MTRQGKTETWRLRGAWVLVAAVTALSVARTGHAALVSFSVQVQDELRVADAELVDRQGVAYLSLSALVYQVGGACRLLPDRVQVDLAAKSAWLQNNAAEVKGSLENFPLGHPVLLESENVLIALSDVTPFFDKAFRLRFRQDGSPPAEPAAQAPPSAPVPQPVPTEPPPSTPEPAQPPPASPTEAQRSVYRPVQMVIIDPGHGGNDTGCEGPAGLKENALTLAVGQKLRQALEKDGKVKVFLTRDKSRDLSGKERVALANANKGDLFVSLHAGGGFSQTASGFVIFCCSKSGAEPDYVAKPASATRAGDVYAGNSKQVAVTLAAAIGETTGATYRGTHAMPCQVLNDLPMPSVLIEMGCLSNPAEETVLQTEAYQDKVAQGIAAGIRKCAEAQAGGGTPR